MPVKARVAPMEVLLQLRSSTLFGDLEPGILAAVATQMRPRAFAAGEVVFRAGDPVTRMYVLTEGTVNVHGRDGQTHTFNPGDGMGVLPLLAQVPVPFPMRAETRALALELPAEAFLDILDDHFPLVEHLMRQLCRALIAMRSRIPENAGFGGPVDPLTCPTRPLDLVERIIVLRRALPQARTSIDALGELSRHMTELRLRPHERLWERGAAADSLLIPVCGEIVCTAGEGQTFRVGAGSIVGALDGLGAEPRWCEAETADLVVGLRIETGLLFDVLDSELRLATALLASLASDAMHLVRDRPGWSWVKQVQEEK